MYIYYLTGSMGQDVGHRNSQVLPQFKMTDFIGRY